MKVTLLDDGVHHLTGARSDGRLVASREAVTATTGWTLERHGLCRGDVCMPVAARARLVDSEGRVDLAELGRALGRDTVVDVDASVVAFGDRQATDLRSSGAAPPFTLPGIDGDPVSLTDFAGQKKALVAWASWCGCRYELAAWQQLHAELCEFGFTILSVALDDSADAAREWVEAASPTYPVAVDPDHVLPERYGIINVPSTVWIDEDERVVRPPSIAPGDDTWREFTKVDSSVHHNALRRWVRDGEVPMEPDEVRRRLGADAPEVRAARLERRVAAYLHRIGQIEAAERHFERALELAPMDWTIRRGSMPLRGQDPFGQEFFDFWAAWEAAGRPQYDL